MNRFPATVPLSEIAQFCRRWRIRELALFGSALRDDFRADSDLDFLVTFAADADWGLLDHIQMEQELQALLQRDVDLVSAHKSWVKLGRPAAGPCVPANTDPSHCLASTS